MARLFVAAALGFIAMASNAAALAADDFLPVWLRCPNGYGDILELTSENILGQRERIRIVCRGKKATRGSVEAAERARDYQMAFEFDLEATLDRREIASFRLVLSYATKEQAEGCNADGTVKPPYLAKVAANREKLKNEGERLGLSWR
jgi:hypothetical protein